MSGDNTEKEGTKGIGILVVILIVWAFLATMCLLIKCDVGGFGSEVLRPVFKDIPVINKILPGPTDAEVAKESDYPYDSFEEALAQLEVQDAAIASKDAEIVALNDKIAELQGELDKLKDLENQMTAFEEEKNKFYDEIVYGESAPDTDTYIEWYNSIDSEKAQEIYQEVLEANEADADIKDLAKTYEDMEPKAAAEVLQSMNNDMDTVALIMNNISADKRADILEQMEPAFAAIVTKKLLP